MDAGVPSGDASEQVDQQTPEQPTGVLPSITSTVSGLPISPAYAGAVGFPNLFRASRSSNFTRGVVNSRPTPVVTPRKKEYIPQRRGSAAIVYRERELIGDGEIHVDPMDAFKPQSFRESKRGDEKIEHPKDKDFKGAGKTAYKSQNKGNQETSAKRQLRYTQV